MERVIVTPEAPGLGQMLGDLIKGNIAAHPDRLALLERAHGSVNINATDAEVEVGLVFTGQELSIGTAVAKPDIAIACDSETLMALSSVPLRMGRPDVMTPQGRGVIKKIVSRQLKVRGMVAHAKLMTQLQKLISVS
jgi:hypothetical protein